MTAAAGCQKAAGCAPKGQVNVKQKVLWRGKYTPEATENTGVIKTFQLGLPNQRAEMTTGTWKQGCNARME